jgi:hypothetical protein
MKWVFRALVTAFFIKSRVLDVICCFKTFSPQNLMENLDAHRSHLAVNISLSQSWQLAIFNQTGLNDVLYIFFIGSHSFVMFGFTLNEFELLITSFKYLHYLSQFTFRAPLHAATVTWKRKKIDFFLKNRKIGVY